MEKIYAYEIGGQLPSYIHRDPQVIIGIASDIFDVSKHMISKGYTHCIQDSETMFFSKEPLAITHHVWDSLDQYYDIVFIDEVEEVI